MNANNDDRSDAADQLLEQGLREVLQGETPPDLSQQILQRYQGSGTDSVVTRKQNSRFSVLRLLALTAGLLIACLIAERLFSGSGYQWQTTDRLSSNDSAQSELEAFNFEKAGQSLELLMSIPMETYGPGKIEIGNEANDAKQAVGDGNAQRIRRNASLQIVVDQFDGVADNLQALVKQHKGFVASTNLGQMRGQQRSGCWTVRIPSANYDAFLASIDQVGILDAKTENAQDVTANYVDLETRIANKQKLEARIVDLLERPDDKLTHVIEVERELARVREEIERMQGQLRVMADQTSLATVTMNVREERDYVPATKPTLSNRIDNAWSNSVSRTGDFLANLIVWLVSMIVPIIGCVLLALFVIIVWRRRRSKILVG